MGTHTSHSMLRLALLALMTTSLTACGAIDRMADIGKPPDLTRIEDPTKQPDYKQVSMPMPMLNQTPAQANSLWRPGSRAFFRDQRAANVGDILTVVINVDDNATLNNESERKRENSDKADATKFLGIEESLGKVLPEAVDPTSLIDMGSSTNNKGTGKIKRDEKIEMKVAAVVTQKLPNGNFVIQGNQQIRVNFERRDLNVAGVIRPEDIASDNTISYEKIAEARVSYGGKGQMTDVQQPRYGSQLYDIIFPF